MPSRSQNQNARRRRRHSARARAASVTAPPFVRAVAVYAHNLVAGTSLRRRRARYPTLEDSPLLNTLVEALPAKLRAPVAPSTKTNAPPVFESPAVRFRELLEAYLRLRGRAVRKAPAPSAPVRGNLGVIARLARLGEVEREILQLLVAVSEAPELEEALDLFGTISLGSVIDIVAALIARSREEVTRALRPPSPLVTTGLVAVSQTTTTFKFKLDLKDGLSDLLGVAKLTRADLYARYLPPAARSPLSFADFEPIRDEAGAARDLLRRALAERRRGTNVLLYGPTGTGKTELARLIAGEIGATLHAVGMADADGDSADAKERLSSLRLGNQLVSNTRAVLLFDELEDLFQTDTHPMAGEARGLARMSKQWFNELLETNPVPTIWITNSIEEIDPAYRRRFSYAIQMVRPGVRQRARVLTRHLSAPGKPRSRVSASDVEAIAQRFPSSPAQLGSAVATARLIAPGGRPTRAAIEQVLAPIEKLVSGFDPKRKRVFDAKGYRLDAVNASEDVAALATRLEKWKPAADGAPGISLCLYGPPGTGKSELVRYLAHRMDRRVVLRRASDLLSMWVGGTERNIAEAFEEAEEDDAVLLFDEADSFLRDRRDASRSWEVTEVNEFLTQLETFQGVVACTTNLWHELDPAALRRFVFKIEMRPLRAPQTAAMFATTLAALPGAKKAARSASAIAAAVSELARRNDVTPGDFAAAARRAKAMGRAVGAGDLLALLEDELKVKKGAKAPAGF